MKQIALISDTHYYLDPRFEKHFNDVDEIWHAGDIGDLSVTDTLSGLAPLRAVYGNIDNHEIRAEFPEFLTFNCENVKVCMTHIAGYPYRYKPYIKEWIQKEKPQIVICGHSHILKVMYDKQMQHLHLNPGAAGVYGVQKVQTILRFKINADQITDLEIVELEKQPLTDSIH